MPEDLVDRLDYLREVLKLCFKYEIDENLFEQLIAIESETDSFPSGVQRSLWSEEKLKEQDAKLIDLYQEDLSNLPHIVEHLLERVR